MAIASLTRWRGNIPAPCCSWGMISRKQTFRPLREVAGRGVAWPGDATMPNELYRLTATEAARQIEAGSLKPADLMEACLDRIAAREHVIHAFAYHDPEAARAASGSIYAKAW